MTHPMSTFPDRFRLDGRTALITGSGRGLGWEIAKANLTGDKEPDVGLRRHLQFA